MCKGKDDEDDVVCIFMYVCVLVLYVCMFSCLMHKMLSSATELLDISTKGGWLKKSSAPEAAGLKIVFMMM